MSAEKAIKMNKTGIAYCLLKNAINWGSDTGTISNLLEKCSAPSLEGLISSKTKDFSKEVAESIGELKANTDIKHVELEAAIITDRDIVGEGLCFMVGNQENTDRVFIFLDDCKLTLPDIKRIYGKPTAEYTAANGWKYYFYGRVFFCSAPDSKTLRIGRFSINN